MSDYKAASYYDSQYGKPLDKKTRFMGTDRWLDKHIFEARFKEQPSIDGLTKADQARVLELCKRMFLAGVSHEQAMEE